MENKVEIQNSMKKRRLNIATAARLIQYGYADFVKTTFRRFYKSCPFLSFDVYFLYKIAFERNEFSFHETVS